MKPDLVLEVVSAVIIRDDMILLTQRDPKRSDFGGLWETPGGKVKRMEKLRAATRREVREELGVEGEVGALVTTVVIEPPVVRRRIRLTFFRVDIGAQTPRRSRPSASGGSPRAPCSPSTSCQGTSWPATPWPCSCRDPGGGDPAVGR